MPGKSHDLNCSSIEFSVEQMKQIGFFKDINR